MATATIEADPRNLCRARPDLVYRVSREFMRSCQMPMPVMPDDAPAHPLQTSVDVAALAPRARSTAFPWRAPPEPQFRAIEQVREFLRAGQLVGTAVESP